MKRVFVAVILLLLAVAPGCILASRTGLATYKNPAINDFVQAAMSQPLEFTLSQNMAEAAWKRAEGFLFNYSPLSVQIYTDTLLQTYPSRGKGPYSYKVTKNPQGDKYLLVVDCIPDNPKLKERALRNAHLLAYYMATGTLSYPETIYR